MSLYCGICSFPYNRILHFENIEIEEKYFAKEISAKNAIHPRWENRNDEGFPKEEILRKYFDILEDAEIDALYKIYKDDFKMFGYQFKYKHFKLNVDWLKNKRGIFNELKKLIRQRLNEWPCSTAVFHAALQNL